MASPDCAEGAYSSLSPATKVPANITNDLSIELWVSSQAEPSPAGSESTVFTMADVGGASFAVVYLGGGVFRFDLDTTAGLVSLDVDTGRPLGAPVQFLTPGQKQAFRIVLRRSFGGSTHPGA